MKTQERREWEDYDNLHNALEYFFTTQAVKDTISFSAFMSWDVIKGEIWYNPKVIYP